MIDPQLMEKWKTELFQDQALNKLFDQDLTLEEFVLLILKNYNMVQLGDIFQKLTSINQSISVQIDHYVKNNSDKLIDDLKDQSHPADNEQVITSMQKIKQIQLRIQENYINKYEKIQKLIPIRNNSEQALLMCKHLQSFSVQLKLLKSLAPQQGNNIIIADAQRVAIALFEIYKLPIKQFQYYLNNQQYIKQIDEQLQIKVNRKFEDSLNAKSVPDLTQCLSMFYSLGRLLEVLENKCNQILKQISEQYKILLSNSKSFLMDYRNQVKNELNQMILIWLIYQAMNQTDNYHLINYQEEVKEQFPNLFLMVWNKYTDVVKQSIQIIIDNKSKYEITYNNLIINYPIIKEIYLEQLIFFNEQILIFPSSVLLTFDLKDIQNSLLSTLDILKPLNQISFQLQLKEQISTLANEVFTQEKGQSYLEKSFNSIISFIDFTKNKIENLKLNVESFIFISERILQEFNSIIESFIGIQFTTEFITVFSLCIPYFWKQFLDHPLNYNLQINQLKNQITLKQMDQNLQQQFDLYYMKRKIGLEQLIQQILKN